MVFGFGKPNVKKMEMKRDIEGLIEALHYKKDRQVRCDAISALCDLAYVVKSDKTFRMIAEAVSKANEGRYLKDMILINDSRSEDARKFAAASLSLMGRTGVKYLMEALTDYHNYDKSTVILALGSMGGKSLNELIKHYKGGHRNWNLSRDALRYMGEPAVESLIKVLEENESMRSTTVEILGDIGDARAVKPLIGSLKDKNEKVRWHAADALGKIGEPAVEPLIKALKNEENELAQSLAIIALEKIDESYVDKIHDWMANNSEKVAHYRIAKGEWDKVIEIGEPAVKPLMKALKDKNWTVQMNAADALGKIGKPAVESLIEVLEDENNKVREFATTALGNIGDPRAVEPLIEALEDESLSEHATKALGNIGDDRAVEPLLNVTHRHIEEYIVEALSNVGEIAVESLLNALNDKNDRVRERATTALGNIGDDRAVEPLINALEDENDEIMRSTVFALGKIGKPAVKPLLNVLNDKNDRVRERAAWALGDIGDDHAVKPLLNVLNDKNDRVRERAAWALGNIGDDRAVEPLINALEDESDKVLRSAVWALGNIGDDRAMEPLYALDDQRISLNNVEQAIKKIRGTIWTPNARISK